MKRKLNIRNLIILIVCAVALCGGIWFITNKNNPTADSDPKNGEEIDQKEEKNESDIDFEDEEVIEIGDDEGQGGF